MSHGHHFHASLPGPAEGKKKVFCLISEKIVFGNYFGVSLMSAVNEELGVFSRAFRVRVAATSPCSSSRVTWTTLLMLRYLRFHYRIRYDRTLEPSCRIPPTRAMDSD